MVIKMFAIRDDKAEAFMSPFFMQAVGMALRAFADLAHDASSNVGKHPGDYVLYQVGEFDDSSGRLVGVDIPVRLGVASEFLDTGVVPIKGKVSA